MRILPCFLIMFSWAPAGAQHVQITPTDELRASVREWVETMAKIQQEENDWRRDQDVLKDYKAALEAEIASLKEQIALAKTRKEGADQSSLDKLAERDRFVAAEELLKQGLQRAEENLAAKTKWFPQVLRGQPKIAHAIEALQRALLEKDAAGPDVGKRLSNVTELVAEAEKFQQEVHVVRELHKDRAGREFQMQMVYFGLALAYGVNEDASFAVAGCSTADGWVFHERNDLAPTIRKLVVTATSETDHSFTNLPLIKP